MRAAEMPASFEDGLVQAWVTFNQGMTMEYTR